MCSLNSRRSILQPIMIPEFGYPPLSPSDPGYPSPAESDTVQTPFVEHPYLPAYFDHLDQRGDGLGNGHGHAHSHNTESKHVHESRVSGNLPHLPQLFSRSPTLDTPPYRDSSPLPRLTPAFDYESSPMEVDPFVSPFSSYNIESQPTQSHDQSTVHVVSSSLQNLEKSSSRPASIPQSTVDCAWNLKARLYSSRFPVEHKLNPYFLRVYELGDELGSGGHGFVIAAHHRIEGLEVAVKFIIKEKIPEHGWMEDETIGRLPTEVMLLSFIDHENVVRCLDLFEDSLYFYLVCRRAPPFRLKLKSYTVQVQELHGSPWPKAERNRPTTHIPATSSATLMTPSTPSLSPSASDDSLADFEPATPPPSSALYMHPQIQLSDNTHEQPHEPHQLQPSHSCTTTATRPDFSRRPSHDLFECIEQSEHRCLSENQARYVFAQVVEAIYYLDSQGVTHRDIKDENLVINADLKASFVTFLLILR